MCCSFQTQAVEELVEKTINTAKRYKLKTVVLAGGVACNSHLREMMKLKAEENKINLSYPKPILCTDNGAMIGAEAYNLIKSGEGLADINLVPDCTINLKYNK